jgi:hypothetical protein
MSLNDDINNQLGGASSSLYETIDIDGKGYSIPYVNGLPEDNKELIAAAEEMDSLGAKPKDYTWEQASKIYGNFGWEVLRKMNSITEEQARILSVKGNVKRMYTIWGAS